MVADILLMVMYSSLVYCWKNTGLARFSLSVKQGIIDLISVIYSKSH